MNTTLKICAGFGIFFAMTACSLEAKKSPSLLLRFDPQSEARESLAPMRWFQSSGPHIFAAPAITQFQCLGINVTGPGIADSSISKPDTAAQTAVIYQGLRNGSSCSYRGVIGGMTMLPATGVYSPLDVSLSIPAGPGRMIQVFGVGNLTGTNTNTEAKAQAMCNTALQGGGQAHGDSKVIYELARAQIPSLFSSRSMTLHSNLTEPGAWNVPAAKLLDCEKNTCKKVSGSSSELDLVTNPNFIALGSMEAQDMFGMGFQKNKNGKFNVTASLKMSAPGPGSVNLNFKIYTHHQSGVPVSAIAGFTVNANIPEGNTPQDVQITIPDFDGAVGYYWLVLEGAQAPVYLYSATTFGVDEDHYRIRKYPPPAQPSWEGASEGYPFHSIQLCGPN